MFNKKRKYNCISCPLKTSCFNVLSEEELQILDDNRLEIIYNKGEIICKQGSFANNILHIPEGICKIYVENNEKRLILDLVNYNFLIGLNSLFYSNILEYSAACLDNSIVCSINRKAFVKIASTNTTFAILQFDFFKANSFSA
ncbi:MAG: Crp/Fnr family transcriptional regulator, partial [Chlorobi bacterium]|nr:Crp/Fnr family transcriptional regulator [Chlorobiota bacterium]